MFLFIPTPWGSVEIFDFGVGYLFFQNICSFLSSYLRGKKKEKNEKKEETRNCFERLRFAQPKKFISLSYQERD